MLNRRLIGLLALLLSAGLSIAACGGDDDNSSGKSNNGKNNNNGPGGNNGPGTNNGPGGDQDASGDDTASPENDTTSPGTGCAATGVCADGYSCNTDTGVCEAAPTGCDAANPDRPTRCDEARADVDFGPTSLVTAFQLAAADCCFDLNDDGEPDNKLSLLETLVGVNAGIQDSIESGSLVLIFEHAGLTSLDSSDPYNLNVWLGKSYEPPVPEEGLLIDPASIDQGTQPQASLPNAKIVDGVLTAGPGIVDLNITLPGILDDPISLRISAAQIEATVDPSSSIEDGIVIKHPTSAALPGGKLGGAVRVDDLFSAVNTFASTCTCLGLDGDDFVIYDPATPEVRAKCDARVPSNTCEADGESTCASLTQLCSFASTLGGLADVDTDGDGTVDAISIGTQFNTTGVKVQGFAEDAAP